MVRPLKNRRIYFRPNVRYFKPPRIPLSSLEEVLLTESEMQAIKYCDFDGLYHEDAAKKMQISRPTLSRILVNARNLIADALVNGKAIRIEEGQTIRSENNEINEDSRFRFGRGRGFRGGRK